MTIPEPIAVTFQVVDVLESLHVTYLIGGSLASALYGVTRATMDADLVADLRPEHVEPLARALSDAFYLDVETMRHAVRQRSSFNVIHLATMFKVDIFVSKGRPFDRAQLERRTSQVLATDPDRLAYIASAEDTILAKLEWFRKGGEVSDRQWQDVLNVLKVQRGCLDESYLADWASQLGVADLLERAIAEAILTASGIIK